MKNEPLKIDTKKFANEQADMDMEIRVGDYKHFFLACKEIRVHGIHCAGADGKEVTIPADMGKLARAGLCDKDDALEAILYPIYRIILLNAEPEGEHIQVYRKYYKHWKEDTEERIRRGQNIPRDPEYIAFAALVATLEYFTGGPLYQIYLQDHGRGPTGIKN